MSDRESPDSALGNLLVISAPSGAGKTSLLKALIETRPELMLSVSHTTRAKRPGEVSGRDYHFIDTRSFEAMVEAGEFVEHARVFDNYYGTSKTWLASQREAGHDVILEIDCQGASQIRARLRCTGIFIFPPSLAVLEQRLRTRAQDDAVTIARRLGEARNEMQRHSEFDYVVVNDVFETALGDLDAIIRAESLAMQRQTVRHRALIASLLGRRVPS